MRNFEISIIKLLLMEFVLLILSSSIVLAQVNVNLPTLTRQQGSEAEWIDVTVGDLTGQNVTAFQFTVSYNKNIIKVDSAIVGPIVTGGYFNFNADAANQQMKVAFASAYALSGAGILVQLKVQYINSGTSSLAFNGTFEFNSGTPSANVTDGIINVINGSLPPTVLTLSATDISSTLSTLNGSVNPNGLSTTVQFEYGTTTSYNLTVTASPNPLTGSTSVNVSANIIGLSSNTLYHYRAKAANSAGTTYGADLTFSTPVTNLPPIVLTLPASNVSSTSATLNGLVDANDLSSTVQFEYGTTTSYGNTVTAIQSPVDGNSNVNVSGDIAGLKQFTIYHFRVKAINIGGTNYGEDYFFTTTNVKSPPTVSTLSATTISSTSSTLNGSVNANGSTSTVQFDYGTSTSYGSTVTASQNPVSGSLIENVTANITGLTPNTLYHYRISATNNYGTSIGADSTFITLNTDVTPTVSTLNATNISSTSSTLNGLVNANGSTSTVQFDYGTSTSYGSNAAASQNPVSGSSTENVTANITSLTPNTLYHYRINATNSIGTGYGSDMTFTTNINYPQYITLSATINFSGIYNQSYYRLIGIPGDTNISLSSLVTGTQKADWNAYWDTGTLTDYQKEYDGTETFNLTPGNAFWVISKNVITLNKTVSTVRLSSNQTYPVPLHAGWNLISNPFGNGVSWYDVATSNNITQPIWGFAGSYTQSNTFEPYQGYYFDNISRLSNLNIPYTSTLGKSSEQTKPGVRLMLQAEDQDVDAVEFRYNKSSLNGLDGYDIYSPGDLYVEASINIVHPEGKQRANMLKEDDRPAIGSGQEYSLQIKNVKHKHLSISITDKTISEPIYLVDDELKQIEEISSKLELESTAENKMYRLIVGEQEYIEQLRKAYIPKEFALNQNYPNPFNPQTTINYSVKKAGMITIKVYNVLGKEIASLVNENKSAGNYSIRYTDDGRNASGIYFCRMKAGNYSQTRKLILLK